MRLICCLCGRPTTPAAMIGSMAVGPKCARKANLLDPKQRKGSVVILKRKRKEEGPETRDLFDNLEEYEE